MIGSAWAEGLSVEAAARLRRAVAQIAASTGCIGWSTAWRVVVARADGVTDQHVVRALADLGVRVADLPRLPVRPPARPDAQLLDDVSRLRLRLSVQAVFADCTRVGFRVLDGFALTDGRVVDAAAVEAATRRTAITPDPLAAQRILSQLRALTGSTNGVDDLVLWDVVRLLRPLRHAGMAQRALRTQATLLGVIAPDAELVAAALVEENGRLEVDDGLPDSAISWSTALPSLDERPRPPPPPVPSTATRGGPEVDPRDRPPAAPLEPTVHEATAPPVDVPRIAVRPGRPGHVRVTWSTPPEVDVVFRRAAHPPRERPGAVVGLAAVWSHGETEPTTGAERVAHGRMSRDIPVPGEPAHLTIYALLAEVAVVGNTVALRDPRPVDNLQVDRFGRQAVLGWGWPPGAIEAVVSWTTAGHDGPDAEPMRCTRRDLERGLRIVVGYRAVTFSVRAVYGYAGREVEAPPAERRLDEMGVPVRYEIEPKIATLLDALRRRRCRVLLTAEDDCLLPDILVVEGRGERRPTEADGGQVLYRLAGRAVAAGETLTVEIELVQRGPSWLVCFADPSGRPDADSIVLEDPPEAQMRRR